MRSEVGHLSYVFRTIMSNVYWHLERLSLYFVREDISIDITQVSMKAVEVEVTLLSYQLTIMPNSTAFTAG